MLGSNLRKTTISPSEYQLCFAWALKPVLRWMHLFGIPTDAFHLPPRSRCNLVLLIGTFMVVWSESSLLVVVFVEVSFKPNLTETLIERWTSTLSECVSCSTTTIITANLIIASYYQWKPLWQNVEEIECHMIFDESCCRSLRKASYGAVIVLGSVKIFRNSYHNLTQIKMNNQLVIAGAYYFDVSHFPWYSSIRITRSYITESRVLDHWHVSHQRCRFIYVSDLDGIDDAAKTYWWSPNHHYIQ